MYIVKRMRNGGAGYCKDWLHRRRLPEIRHLQLNSRGLNSEFCFLMTSGESHHDNKQLRRCFFEN